MFRLFTALFSITKGFRTLTLAGVIALLASLQLTDLVPWFGPIYGPVAFYSIAAVIILLRAYTDTAIGKKI